MPAREPLPCPVCAALVLDDDAHLNRHAHWHARQPANDGPPPLHADLLARFREVRDLARLANDAPTAKLPPVGETVRRRPPVPPALDPGTPAMLRALAAAMEDDGLDAEQLTWPPWQLTWPPCQSNATVAITGAPCRWPNEGPCLAYGSSGCGMKAQEK